MGHEQNRSMFRCVVLGMGVCLFLFLTGTISANEPGVHSELHRQKNDSRLEWDGDGDHSWKLNVLWIIPIILFVVGCVYLDRRCPACKKGWGLRYTGNTENRAKGRWAWLIKDKYDEYRCKHCGYEEWREDEDVVT